jgi:hypothetical protein
MYLMFTHQIPHLVKNARILCWSFFPSHPANRFPAGDFELVLNSKTKRDVIGILAEKMAEDIVVPIVRI